MANDEINSYITKRYYRWLDYARFHCRRAHIPNDAMDVLNEVLASLLQKDTDKLSGLLRRKKGDYTELDWFVIRMIKLNIKSPTSPYQLKTCRKKIDNNVDVFSLQVEDTVEEPDDEPAKILNQMNAVREALDDLCISDKHKAIFSFRFFQGESFADWKGGDSMRNLYISYNQVKELVRVKIKGEVIF